MASEAEAGAPALPAEGLSEAEQQPHRLERKKPKHSTASGNSPLEVCCLANEKDQKEPIACRFCDKIFLDNKSLLNHFQSHLHDGTFNGRPVVGRSVPPGDNSNSISRSFQHTHSLSAPVNVHNYVAHENIGPCASQNVSPNMLNLSLGNSLGPTHLQNSVQLRGATLTNRPQSSLSPSVFSSAISHYTFASQPNPSPNFHSRFASQHSGSLNSHFPIMSAGPDVFTSETTEQSSFNFATDLGTITLALGATRCPPQTSRKNEVAGPSSGYTKPYIKQLERPIQETIVVHLDEGGNNNLDEMDLTLKLG